MPTFALILIFLVAVVAVWLAGVRLSNATDALDRRFGLGEAMGGLLLLAIATNLPEIAITSTAALHGNIELASGNLLGGVAIQTVVLVALDRFGGRESPLSHESRVLSPVLEGAIVISVLVVVIMGGQLQGRLVWRIEPAAAAVALVWIAGLFLIRSASHGLPWTVHPAEPPQGSGDNAPASSQASEGSVAMPLLVFATAALVTLAGGVALERTGDLLAGRFGMEGILFGATILAAATAVPELATGIASMRMGDTGLAFSDIFGGNAFLPALFLLACLLSGQATIAGTGRANVYLAALGCLLTAIYIVGLVFRSPRRIGGIGLDSAAVLALYILGIAGIVLIA